MHIVPARDPNAPDFDDHELPEPSEDEGGIPTPPSFIAEAAADLADVPVAAEAEAEAAFPSGAPHAPSAFIEADTAWADYDSSTADQDSTTSPPAAVDETASERFVTVGGPTRGGTARPVRAGWERPVVLEAHTDHHDTRVATDRRKRPRLEDASQLSDKQIAVGALAATLALSVVGYLVHVLL